LKVTFLGTGTSQGVPVIACKCDVCLSGNHKDKRLRTSALIEVDGKRFLIDIGPDFRQQMLSAGVDNIDAVLLTHEHHDHVGGLDDVRAFNFINKAPVDFYADIRVLEYLQSTFSYAFGENKYPGAPNINLHEIDDDIFTIDDVRFTRIKGFHYRLPISGFRVGDFAYLTDFNYISDEEKEKLFGVKYLVINALRKQKHISHFSLPESLKLIKEISPKKAYLTHLSHQMGLHDEVSKILPDNVEIAYDGLVIDF
jgi:phosphoribosyl 1,2-cyclic phosphate phosphodiesterase